MRNCATQRITKFRFWKIEPSESAFERGWKLATRGRARGYVVSPGDKGLKSAFQHAPDEKNATLTLETAEPNIGPKADNAPFVAAARMWLAETYDVIEPKFDDHLVR